MTLPLDQLIVRIDRKLDTMAVSLEGRWDRKGDAPRSQRWGMRRPLLSPLIGPLSALVVVAGVEGLRVLSTNGDASFQWPPLLFLAVITALFLPFQYRLYQHMGRRYRAWQHRNQPTSQSTP